MRKLFVVAVAAAAVCVAFGARSSGTEASSAEDQSASRVEFARVVGESFTPPEPEPLEELPGEQLFDADGNSNDLIILLNPEKRAEMDSALALESARSENTEFERSVVDAINSRSTEARAYFSDGAGARRLIRSSRLSSDLRQKLKATAPMEIMQRYIVVRYPTVDAAKAAQRSVRGKPSVQDAQLDQRIEMLWSPNDTYFPQNAAGPTRFQWGMHAMRFPQAWDRTRGNAYVAAIDLGLRNGLAPADLVENYRSQFSYKFSDTLSDPILNNHATHVLGIIGATGNNAMGVVGGCPSCSVSMIHTRLNSLVPVAEALIAAVDRGTQVINMSFGTASSCALVPSVCNAIAYANDFDVLLVAAAGNAYNATTNFPASHPDVLSVGGTQSTALWQTLPSSWDIWNHDGTNGSSRTGQDGVVAPARSIISTVIAGEAYNPLPYVMCGDTSNTDESGNYGDGYGTCTGTSMAAPHVAALAGILRSIDPLRARTSISDLIRSSSDLAILPNVQRGSGLPNAQMAVNTAISQTQNRLTPLFSMYSAERLDYFYTSVPQMASVASWGTLRPANSATYSSRYYPASGNTINSYVALPGAAVGTYPVLAEVWVFTTPENPKNSQIPLAPLYRWSWKCGDPYPAAVCSSSPNHSDTAYTTGPSDVALTSYGFKLDGLEGYMYPKTMPQPPGTVKLMRKYNATRDDHAIFPQTALSAMQAEGYTLNTGSDWLGWVYPNTNGQVPTIQ